MRSSDEPGDMSPGEVVQRTDGAPKIQSDSAPAVTKELAVLPGGSDNDLRLCCAAETASALPYGGTVWFQAQYHDECPGGGSIKRRLYADR